ncbi:hypothetical protein [Robertmurraya korlensis]|uniref:hypothetical protein n=1 Tax=Robertmurraya korlensis TaxID=519977 RepID=UPI0008254CF3|nr:hypothetical protein [Robertmurraya korlensis]
MFEKGSTAVLSTSSLPFIVAVKNAGLYSFEKGEWLLQYSLSQSIYKLVCISPYIFGIGDNGLIVRYNPYNKKWTHTFFPTPQRLWDITGNESGLIITHVGSKLYISYNFGSNWSVVHPFKELAIKPFIRSLFLDKDHLYIGTQINTESGGLWSFSLDSGELTLVKRESTSMISSIYIDCDDWMFIAKGNARSKEGSIEMKSLLTSCWRTLEQPVSEKAFLDVFNVGKNIYTTTSKDEYGFSRLYEINKQSQTLSPIETIEGHGFRGAGWKDELFISSPIESKWIDRRDNSIKLVH